MRIDYKQMEFIHPMLRAVLADIEDFMDIEPTLTSLYRMEDEGVHGTLPLRGADIRCQDRDLGEEIELAINGAWQYDPKRPEMKVCIFHDTGDGPHLHLQVHPNTI